MPPVEPERGEPQQPEHALGHDMEHVEGEGAQPQERPDGRQADEDPGAREAGTVAE